VLEVLQTCEFKKVTKCVNSLKVICKLVLEAGEYQVHGKRTLDFSLTRI